MFKLSRIVCLLILGLSRFVAAESLQSNSFLEKNLASFDYVWTTVRDRYYDTNLGGHDWNAVYDTLRPKVENATNIDEVRGVLMQMLGVFGESHFAIIPSTVYSNLDFNPDQSGRSSTDGTNDTAKTDLSGYPGFDLRLLDSTLVVTSVTPNSPAAEAGIQPGWILTEIKTDILASFVSDLLKQFSESPTRSLIVYSAIKYRLLGPVGDSISLLFLDGENQPIALNISRIPQKGHPFHFGYLPEVYVWMDVDTLEKDIGYIAFNGFMDPMCLMPRFNQAILGFMQYPGIIIDLRGNTGGLGGMAMGMAGWFVNDKNKYLGTLTMRGTELKFIVNPRLQGYRGKVVLLVDALSASCSEFLAGGLQDLQRATLIGEHTAGAALPSMIEKLPNGDGFQYVFANYVSASGHKLEGLGVVPDIEIVPNREALLQGRDLVLEKAIEWILTSEK